MNDIDASDVSAEKLENAVAAMKKMSLFCK